MKKALIVGGTASIAPDIIVYLKDVYDFDLTYQNISHIYKQNEINWINLDFNSYESVIKFVNNVSYNYYDLVIILSMATPGDFWENSDKELKDFYGSYLVNNMIFAKHILQKITKDGKIIYMSSIAGNKSVPSINYSTIKGALQSFFISLATKTKMNQIILSIAPGLIYDTPAFYRHEPMMYNNDVGILTTKKDIADFILNCSTIHNGKLIRLGGDL